MHVNEFLNNLQSAGYWRERCEVCNKEFDATEGEEHCPEHRHNHYLGVRLPSDETCDACERGEGPLCEVCERTLTKSVRV